MGKIINGKITLNTAETKSFFSDIIHPDIEALKKRDVFLESTKSWTIKHHSNGSTILEIPDLKLPELSSLSLTAKNMQDNYVPYLEKKVFKTFSTHVKELSDLITSKYTDKHYSEIESSSVNCVVFCLPVLNSSTKFKNSDFSFSDKFREIDSSI